VFTANTAHETCTEVLSNLWRLFLQDIFRKYPHSYEAVIPTLCANLDELDEPEAKASLIWIIGEYAEKIENADELLGIFLDTFKEESYAVSFVTIFAACSY
jgi:AP-1 complex subunit beta-1